MTSKARSQNAFLYPESAADGSVQEDIMLKGRKHSVYDAVAGRLNAKGFIPKEVWISSTRDTASSSNNAVSPEAVLFRGKNAPTRFAESDIYFANERELQTELPESDLLKALHCYASDFYSRATADSGLGDYRSMDETALIALGILMEEAGRDTLGATGDLVFTEAETFQDFNNSELGETSSNSSKVRRPKKRRRVLGNQEGRIEDHDQ
ncbi:hypothetical protein D0Z07_9297 [Hyphodiscus hymeniophilus]|uniref:Uncharacterized protein n=1 Tax=Hyphodiscus hymeniophilus TaxID=353542 RepID=A0A9P6VDH5_9HELO|nr:hypothetical protein D0Z07_9297 [Hyphodiscus hymeniophilus]